MKTTVSLLSFVLFVCIVISSTVVIAQKSIKTTHYNWTLPEVSPEPELLDTALLGTSKTDTMVRSRDTIIRGYSKNGFDEYHKNKSKGNCWISRGYSNAAGTDDFAGMDDLLDSSFTFGIYKQFYPSGKIKVKGGRSIFRFDFGIWYYFNEDGLLQKTIDYDKGFKFTIADILNYCDKNNIPLANHFDGRPTYINKRWLPNDKRSWAITYLDFAKQQIIEVDLSADDGSLIKRSQQPYTSYRNN